MRTETGKLFMAFLTKIAKDKARPDHLQCFVQDGSIALRMP
jgi:hypothetical protein